MTNDAVRTLRSTMAIADVDVFTTQSINEKEKWPMVVTLGAPSIVRSPCTVALVSRMDTLGDVSVVNDEAFPCEPGKTKRMPPAKSQPTPRTFTRPTVVVPLLFAVVSFSNTINGEWALSYGMRRHRSIVISTAATIQTFPMDNNAKTNRTTAVAKGPPLPLWRRLLLLGITEEKSLSRPKCAKKSRQLVGIETVVG